MNVQQAMKQARSKVIPGVRGLGSMSLQTVSGKNYSVLDSSTLLTDDGQVIDAECITEEIDSVSSSIDELGGTYIS